MSQAPSLTAAKIRDLRNAGYTHYAVYEIHREITDCWVDTGFPIAAPDRADNFWLDTLKPATQLDILADYRERLSNREQAGAIRYARIIQL